MVTTTIKKGYRQTDLGVIPEDWELKHLGSFLDYEQPTDYLVSDTKYNNNNQIPVLTAGKTFILGYTNEEHGIFNRLPVIIFDDFTTAIKFVDFPFKSKSSAMKMLIPQNDKVNMRFVYEKMLQIKYPLGDHKRHWIGEYQHLKIAVPTLPEEQNAIANVLSNTETLVDHLDKLITKKKAVKQGTMQQLLTGKKRLPGFNGEWEMKKLIEVVSFINGKPNEMNVVFEGAYNLITLDSVGIDGKLKIHHKKVSGLDNSLKKDDIVIVLSDIAHAKLLGLCDLIPENDKYVLNQRMGRLRPFGNDNPSYIRLQINFRQDYFKSRGQGTSQRHIYRKDINELEIPIMTDKNEQTAIANLLSDMDKEIELLEQKRDKYIMLKNGMMQQLLTGTIRIYGNK